MQSVGLEKDILHSVTILGYTSCEAFLIRCHGLSSCCCILSCLGFDQTDASGSLLLAVGLRLISFNLRHHGLHVWSRSKVYKQCPLRNYLLNEKEDISPIKGGSWTTGMRFGVVEYVRVKHNDLARAQINLCTILGQEESCIPKVQ